MLHYLHACCQNQSIELNFPEKEDPDQICFFFLIFFRDQILNGLNRTDIIEHCTSMEFRVLQNKVL